MKNATQTGMYINVSKIKNLQNVIIKIKMFRWLILMLKIKLLTFKLAIIQLKTIKCKKKSIQIP